MLDNLTKLYNNKRGIRNISFNLEKSDILGLLGPNGAGKTTLLKTILGLTRKDSGNITILGHDLDNNPEIALNKCSGFVGSFSPFVYLTGFQNLKYVSGFKKNITISKIEEVLKLTCIYDYRHEKVSKYSTGMKQRLGIAMAFLTVPELVILDEPTNGLDIDGIINIRQIISDLNKRFGTTFIISSHQINEIQNICNKVGIIYEGNLISLSKTQEIIDKMQITLEQFYTSNIAAHKKIM